MRMTCELPDHAAAVEALLEGFVLACAVIIEAGLAPMDPLDAPNLVYRLEPAGQEDWKLPHRAVRDGWADCEDVAGWRAARLRVTGEDSQARVRVARTGPGKLHAVVQRSDGSIEDPSRELHDRERRGGRALGASGAVDRGGGGSWWRPPAPQGGGPRHRQGQPVTVNVGPGPQPGATPHEGSAVVTPGGEFQSPTAKPPPQAPQPDPTDMWPGYGPMPGYGMPGYGMVMPGYQTAADWVDPRAAAIFAEPTLDDALQDDWGQQ